MFHAVGSHFIQHYNNKYGLATPWGREWVEQSMAYLHYLMVVQSYNAYHAKFARSFPPGLQGECVDRITHNIGTPNLLLDPAIQWPDGIDVQAPLTPVQHPTGGYQMLHMHERDQIRQVTHSFIVFYCNTLYSALPLKIHVVFST
jgi:hypothetical protein